MPKYELEDVEDYYSYYVLVLGMSEDLFWNADFAFVRKVAENKLAYEGWYNSMMDELYERKRI